MPRPVVLLHGFTGAPGSWDAVRGDLKEEPEAGRTGAVDVLALAALGHDGTPGPPEVDTFEGEVDRLAGSIRSRGIAGAHVAGYSMGGRLALGLLVRHPGLFASATLIGASPGLADAAERAERAAGDEARARLLDTQGLDTFVAAWEALPLFATQARLDDEVLATQARIRRSHVPAGLARSLRVTGLGRMPDYRPELPGIEVPVRLVAGERDTKFRRLAEEMAGLLPRATLTIVPDAGHNVVLERPTIIAGLLREDTRA